MGNVPGGPQEGIEPGSTLKWTHREGGGWRMDRRWGDERKGNWAVRKGTGKNKGECKGGRDEH